MQTPKSFLFVVSLLCATFLSTGSNAADSNMMEGQNQPAATSMGSASLKTMLDEWPERPRLGANEMIAKYGMPQQITSEKVIWNNPGPYKRIMVTREEIPHDFPLPHMDFLEHTISYNVPIDKTGDLIAFDGSSTINRTAGELSARCDLEGHNILTLNLDHDIVTGKKTVEQARKAFGEIVVQDVMGKHPAYVEALQFKPSDESARFPDKPVIPGAPKRTMNEENMSDAEILAFVIAVDMNETLAAAEAQKKKVSVPVLDYAKMLHKEHGKNAGDTMMLGQKIGLTPAATPAVDMLSVKGAGELAMLVSLEDNEFGKAYIDAMVKGHNEVLDMIDNQLLKNADNAALKKHLADTRIHIAAHLEKAKQLQANQ